MFVRSLRWFRVSVRHVLLSLAVQHVGIAANSRVFRLHRPRLLRLLSHPRRRRFLRIAQGNQSRIIRIVVILRLNGIIEAKEILYTFLSTPVRQIYLSKHQNGLNATATCSPVPIFQLSSFI